MRIEILAKAKEDLLEGYRFYERQSPGLGNYFLDTLYSDIDSLLIYAGIHQIVYGKHPGLFPTASRMRSTTPSSTRPYASARCSIVGETLPGFADVSVVAEPDAQLMIDSAATLLEVL